MHARLTSRYQKLRIAASLDTVLRGHSPNFNALHLADLRNTAPRVLHRGRNGLGSDPHLAFTLSNCSTKTDGPISASFRRTPRLLCARCSPSLA